MWPWPLYDLDQQGYIFQVWQGEIPEYPLWIHLHKLQKKIERFSLNEVAQDFCILYICFLLLHVCYIYVVITSVETNMWYNIRILKHFRFDIYADKLNSNDKQYLQ